MVAAAATKPYGYMPFWPGPGLGGHCLPVDPHYLLWKLRSLDYRARFIELADEINSSMPGFVVQKVVDGLNARGRAVKGARVLVLGVAYKRETNDTRESPALQVLGLLAGKGARVSYHDPYIPRIRLGARMLGSRPLRPALLEAQDCVVVATDHACVDYDLVRRSAALIVDSRNVFGGRRDAHIVRL